MARRTSPPFRSPTPNLQAMVDQIDPAVANVKQSATGDHSENPPARPRAGQVEDNGGAISAGYGRSDPVGQRCTTEPIGALAERHELPAHGSGCLGRSDSPENAMLEIVKDVAAVVATCTEFIAVLVIVVGTVQA